MKILFFSPPSELSEFNVKDENAIYPLGLAYLGAVLEKENHNVKVYDYFQKTWEEIKPLIPPIIDTEKPDIIGISSMTMNRTSAFKLVRMIKKINPKITVILGGVHPTVMYEQILKNFPVDFIVCGEAEGTIIELLKAIKEKRSKKYFEKIKGIAFKSEDKILKTEPRPALRDLDSLPFPKHVYFKDKIEKNKKAYMMTSRGCPFGCLFCSTSDYWGRMRRERSVGNVMKEIKSLLKDFPYIEEIFFVDDEFTLNQQRVINLCKEMIKERINIRWDCSTRVSSVSSELAYWMKKANCIHVSLGVESGAPELIERIHKRITNKQVEDSLRIFHNAGIATSIYLIVGLPGENSQTVNKTIHLLKRVAKTKPEFKKPALLQIYPHTELYELAKKQGIIDDDYWLSEKLVPHYTFEHSKNKLLYWSLKIAIFNKFYQGELLSFIKKIILNPLKALKLIKLGK